MAVDVRKPLKKYVPQLMAAREQNLNKTDIDVRLIKYSKTYSGPTACLQLRAEYI